VYACVSKCTDQPLGGILNQNGILDKLYRYIIKVFSHRIRITRFTYRTEPPTDSDKEEPT